jgi:hypothetical protein
MKLPDLVVGARYRSVGVQSQLVRPAGLIDILCDNFPWLPFCEPPAETCQYDRTDTSCWGVALMCRDRGRTASGKDCRGGWYPCGVCLGLPF